MVGGSDNLLDEEDQKMIMSGYLIAMGFGLPAALAAQHHPDRQVVSITGDGGFSMIADFLTAVQPASS